MKNKLLLAVCAATGLLTGCVTVDGKGLSIDGTCVICKISQEEMRELKNPSFSSSSSKSRNSIAKTTFISPVDVDSSYALLVSEFGYQSRDQYSDSPLDSMYVLQSSYEHVKTPGSYYNVSDEVRYNFKGRVVYPIIEFEIIKYKSKAKIKLKIHHRFSSNDTENDRLMNELLESVKVRTLNALR